ncbi:MAG: methionine--tRNA ligase subunit beta [Planctomycetota bacterium]
MAFKDTITFDDFVKLDLRVATIVEAEAHPNADRLLKLQVDLGEERRQICAGIRGAYDPDDLVGKQIVVVANLAPRSIRGQESNGMLLAASIDAEDGGAKALTLVTPMAEIAPGASVG